jgi:hypothetical protein
MSAVSVDSFACADGEAPNRLMFGHRRGGSAERCIPRVASLRSRRRILGFEAAIDRNDDFRVQEVRAWR